MPPGTQGWPRPLWSAGPGAETCPRVDGTRVGESARVDDRQHGTARGADSQTRRLAALVRDSPDLVGVLDADGSVRYLSPAAVQLFTGAEPAAIVNGRHLELVHRADVDELAGC